MLRINIALDEDQEERLHHKLDRIIRLLEKMVVTQGTLNREIANMAGELDRLTSEVEESTTVQQSAIVLLNNLGELIRQAGTDPAKLSALADQLDSNANALAAAITANTPAA